MNSNEFYERPGARTTPKEPTPPTQSADAVSALAHHTDPSVSPAPAEPGSKAQQGIAWVRPSELPTLVGSKVAGRGIDLQSDLVRRSRRAPAATARAGRRISRTAIARTEPATPTTTTTQELGI